MTFSPLSTDDPASGWGMSPFNASLGKEVIRISDQVLQAVAIISDTRRIVDITPHNQSAVACRGGPNMPPAPRCERHFFAPGGIEAATTKFDNDPELSKSEAFLAKRQQSYILSFIEGEDSWTFEDSECLDYGFGFAAFLLCAKNNDDGSIKSREHTTYPPMQLKSDSNVS